MTQEELLEMGLSQEQAGKVLDAWRQHDESRAVRFTAPLRDQTAPTKEQIMAIPDRALRRAAIVENMKLFKGDD